MVKNILISSFNQNKERLRMLKSDPVLIDGLWSAVLRFMSDLFIQKLLAMSISFTGLKSHPNKYSDSDIPWKFCTSKTASL